MGRESYLFEGLVEFEQRLRRLAASVSYLTVTDRTERNNEDQLGRFDFTTQDALPYLAQGEQGREEGDEGAGSEEHESFAPDEEDADDDEDADDKGESAPADIDAIASAGCRWLRDIARRNTVGEPYRRFRVKAYGAKGVRVVDTATFVCKNNDHDLDLPIATGPSTYARMPEILIPTPTFEDAATQGAARGYKALGDAYAQFSQILLGAVSQVQGVNNAMLSRTHQQLEESREQVEQLLAAILESRTTELKLAEERRTDERTSDNRTEIAKHALAQLGETAKSLLTLRGLPPELSDVLGDIGQSPALLSALKEPDVRDLVKDPQNLELLANLLRQVGQQARLLRTAAASTPTTP